MKTTMKKLTATVLALLLMIQILPAFAEEDDTPTSNGVSFGDNFTFRDTLEITSKTSILVVGDEVQLEWTEGYELKWKSDHEEVATVDKNGLVTAVGEGTVKITGKEGNYSDSITLKVVAPKASKEKEKEETEGSREPQDEQEAPKEETMIIVINVNKDKITYDGAVHTAGFTSVSNSDGFDSGKVRINPDRQIEEKDCGTYKTHYDPSDFTYDGKTENIEFIISDGWMQIKPATVTVKANDVTQTEDEKPEFTAVVTGLVEGDDPEAIQYTFDVYTIGNVTYINPVCDPIQGNYKVKTEPGILVVENGTYRAIKLTSDWPADKPAYAGTMITMTAELIGFEGLDYTLQWQHSTDKKEWEDEPGANGISFTYELNETTCQYTWRVVAKY